ncbi:DUF3284 domain-containing protein [Enterococcus sp. BWB1-3]|uniref:DUF3284 domain-containing protein n=1 Tax=Enterococcus sp. BWB1-3 TaxID=2787713 RepID=UPI001920A337|nr:DUF3284 domain-containing protein [Enterococcus sp. BWB1-3]
MEVVKKLNIPAPVFYKKIIESVIYDIRVQTGKDVTEKQLNNFEYVKTFSKSQRAKIKIDKIEKNSAYHFSTSTTKNEFKVSYDITMIDDNSCEIRYAESMESYGTLQKMNDIVLSMLLGFFKKRQFKKMLEQMENS